MPIQILLARVGDKVKMWRMFDFKTPYIAGDISYRSIKAQFEYDCKEEQERHFSVDFLFNIWVVEIRFYLTATWRMVSNYS